MINKLEFVRNLNLTLRPETNYRIVKRLKCKKYQGTARIVICLNDEWVLKVAKNDDGIFQNRKESHIWNMASKRERKSTLLCQIFLSELHLDHSKKSV